MLCVLWVVQEPLATKYKSKPPQLDMVWLSLKMVTHIPRMPWWLLKVAAGLFLEKCHLVHNCPKHLVYYRSKELHLLPTPSPMCRVRKLRVSEVSEPIQMFTGCPAAVHTLPKSLEGSFLNTMLEPRTKATSHISIPGPWWAPISSFILFVFL